MTATFDCHDDAYYRWRDAGIHGATLIHVDAHHDLEPDTTITHVGNFVRVAIDEKIVARVVWVLPQPMWDDQRTRAVARHDLAALAGGIDATVVPLPEADGCTEPVLLDVDLDYLFTTAFDHDRSRSVLPEPWCGAGELARELNVRWPRRLISTVATSLTGGFTPVGWKHLATELAARLDARDPAPGWDAAAREFQEAERLHAGGARDEARLAFARALAADGEYRHPFRTHGYLHRRAGRVDAARRAFDAALDLDPGDGWAHLGLAMVALDEGDAAEAVRRLGDLRAGDERVDAWRTASIARGVLGDVDGAIEAGRRVLALSLAGGVPLSLWTSNHDRRLVDPQHAHDHARLAVLHRRAGHLNAARAHQRIADAAGVAEEESA